MSITSWTIESTTLPTGKIDFKKYLDVVCLFTLGVFFSTFMAIIIYDMPVVMKEEEPKCPTLPFLRH